MLYGKKYYEHKEGICLKSIKRKMLGLFQCFKSSVKNKNSCNRYSVFCYRKLKKASPNVRDFGLHFRG